VSINRRKLDQQEAAARRRREERRAAVARRIAKDAKKIVGIWNARNAAGAELWFYPTIGAALAAGTPWLTWMCPACETLDDLDLRKVDRHPAASISSLIPSLQCGRCNGSAPLAKLVRMSKLRADI
jgi:hypothetical protein